MSHTLRLAYSPDADDAFMFRAALEQLVDTEGIRFEAVTADTQRLNELADRGDIDVSAISVAAWPSLSDRFLLLPHGGSVGRGYGPVVVSRHAYSVADLSRLRIASPGNRTTAHLVTLLIAPDARFTTVPITPYQAVFEAIDNGDVDAGIVIHEGRLTYAQRGLLAIVDLGVWWGEMSGLPLPLGANVIRRALGDDVIGRASRALQRSIGWGLEHREEMIEFLIDHVHRPPEVATRDLLDRYLAMYANQETYSYSPDTLRAFDLLYHHAHRIGMIERPTVAEFAAHVNV